MQTSPAIAADAHEPAQSAPARTLISWMLFDWAVQPFHTLIITFLFASYFASTVVGDAATGQQYWGWALAAAGVIIALASPVLGAMADGRGSRKPWIAAFVAVLAGAMAALWLATPAAGMETILLVLAAVVVGMAAAEFTAVFTNAFMPSLVPREQLGRLSGNGWALGYLGGLVSLLLVAGLVVPVPGSTQTMFGFDPLLTLDPATHEADRLIGPLAAVWLIVFMLPFFLFVPEAAPVARADSSRPATAELMDTLRSLPSHPNMLYFLIARMIYSDGISAIFAFGGIYGTAVFGWQSAELALFGIIVIVTGVIGSFAGGIFDDRVGPRTVIVVSLLILLVGAAGILSVDPTHVLYTVEVAQKAPGSPPLSSTGEMVFIAFAVIIGMVSAPVQAASRSLLARLAPPDKVTQYFGLFAFSGKATAFLAPALVALVTGATGSQRLGMATIAIFLLVGMLLMLKVRSSEQIT